MKRIRAYSIELLLVGALLAAVGFFGYLGYGLLRPEVINEPFSGEKALANLSKQLEFGPRITGTDASVRTGDWLIEQMRLLGWDVIVQPITVQDTVAGRNIIGVRSHSSGGAPVALLATHYDTRLVADADPDPANQASPPAGANVGASGVAVLLELARTLDVEATGHTVCLAFFDAEENAGLPGWDENIGSQLFVESLPDSIPRCAAPQFVVYLDAVGATDQRFFQSETADQSRQAALWRTAANLDFGSWFPDSVRPTPLGGHLPFAEQGVPVVTLIGQDYPYRDTLLDTLDKVSVDTLSRVGLTLETWLEAGP